jgi:hypothetical protein
MHDPQGHPKWLAIVLLITAIWLLGMLLLHLLFRAWRRFNARQEWSRSHTDMPDIWKAGGERLPPGAGPAADEEEPGGHDDD